jgi:hypothetical protein
MLDKKYKTRDGKPGRIICTDCSAVDKHPVISLVNHNGEREQLNYLTSDLRFLESDDEPFLIEIPATEEEIKTGVIGDDE